MNYSTAIFLINNKARALSVTYEAEERASREIVKTLDPNITIGDFVIVQTNTRHKMTVCKVVEADIDFDLDTTANMNWIVGKVDTNAFGALQAQENQAIQAIKSVELRQKRDNLREGMLKNSMDAIKALPIVSLNGDAA